MERLDVFVKNALNISRTQSARLIAEGFVTKEGKALKKPSFLTDGEGIEIDKTGLLPYCGRGGLKLEKALEVFGIDVKGKTCLDIGASTGGFTQCLLNFGAERVYSVDVGTSQLDEVLLKDKRVVSMEQTNILDVAALPVVPTFVCCDVSFVSLNKILPKAYELISEQGEGVFLIKPQFEAGRKALNKKGICKDPKDHIKVIKNITAFAAVLGFKTEGLIPSPIKGGSGNTEYLIYLKKAENVSELSESVIKAVVKEGQI
ncbi:MAG: TlyA family RNA methyltransferase [Clostridiales bacterium]|nr:TlyA family RNA methyltransferase [Clostridiales bacterium]